MVGLELDRSADPVAERARRYGALIAAHPLRLVVVSHRPDTWETACKGYRYPAVIVQPEQVGEIKKAARRRLV